MPPTPKKKFGLTNRGPAGLLNKLPAGSVKDQGKLATQTNGEQKDYPINRIAPSLRSLAIDLSSVNLDPNNAKLHPEKSVGVIKESLQRYGQKKPIVVRKEGMVVVAGNGTVEAARELGWTEIAANVESMSNVEAIGYGIADNRSAEFSKWDFEKVTMLEKIMSEQGEVPVGWTMAELTVLRTTNWTPPEVGMPELPTEGRSNYRELTFTLHEQQLEIVKAAVSLAKGKKEQYNTSLNENSNGNALTYICQLFISSCENGK